jgi:hypothetical protein
MAGLTDKQQNEVDNIQETLEIKAENSRRLGATEEEITTLTGGKVTTPERYLPDVEEPILTEAELDANMYANTGAAGIDPYQVTYNSNENQRETQAASATVLAIAHGQDSEAAYEEFLGLSPEESKEQISQIAMGEIESEFSGAFDLLTSRIPDSLMQEDATELGTQFKQEMDNLEPTASVLNVYKNYAKAMPNGDQFSPELVDDIAVAKYMQDKISAIMDDDYSIMDGVSDFAGLMFVPNISYDTAVLNQAIGDGSAVGTYANSREFLFKVRGLIGDKTIPAKQRMKFFDTVAKELEGIESNKMKQIMFLMGTSGIDQAEITTADEVFDKMDQLIIVSHLGTGVIKAVRGMNNLVQIAGMADTRTMGVMVDMGSRSDSGAKALGVPRQDAVIALDPRAKAIEDMIDGAPVDLAAPLRDEISIIDKLAVEAGNTVEEGLGLTKVEQEAALRDRITGAEKLDDIENVRGEITPTGINLTYDVVTSTIDEATEAVTDITTKRITVNSPYTQDDITKGFQQEKVTFIGQALSRVASPNFLQGKDKAAVVQAFERILFQGAKIKGDFNKALNVATKGLNKLQAENVSAMLLKGDDDKTVYSFDELVLQGVGGNKLSEKEYTAYAGVRRIMDNAWAFKNKETRSQMVARGIKEITVEGKKLLTKPIDKLGSAKTAYRESSYNSVLVTNPLKAGETNIANMTDEVLERHYKAGYKLVRGDTVGTFFKNGETNSAWALVKKADIKDIPPVVLNKQRGYVTRSYKDAHFFVKQSRKINVDGVQKFNGQRTLRYFDNATEAEAHVLELGRRAAAAGNKFDPKDYSVLADREMRSAELDIDNVDMFGGLYNSPRRDEALRFGPDGVEGQRVDAIESIQNYVNHIGNRVPMAEYRIGIQKRWMNEARNKGMLPDGFKGSFDEAFPIVQNRAGDPRIKTKLVNAHKHISFMVKTPTVGEQNLQGVVRSIGRSLEKTSAKGLSKYIYRLDHNDPVNALKGATFNLLLGMYNWSQVLVQGLGATVAISINPVHGLKSLPNTIAFAYLDNIKNPNALEGAIKILADNKNLDVLDLATDYAAWKKTGLYESVVNSNADVASIMQGMPYDAGVLRKVWANGTLPFKMGELANMRISFSTALSKWKSMNKGRPIDDDAIKQVVARAEQLRLQMSSGNKADYQKGLMAIPTQFFQINAKFIEAVGGDNFTKMEKVRLFGGQAAIFGAAGIPAGTAMYKMYMDITGRDITEMTSGEAVAEQRGAIGWYINEYLGFNSVVVSRTAIGGSIGETLLKFSTEPAELYKLALGPSTSSIESSANVVMTMLRTAKISWETEDMTPTKYGLLAKVMAESVAGMAAGTRNPLLAYHLREGKAFQTKSGRYVYQEDQNTGTLIMQALGFSNQDYSDSWVLQMDEKVRTQNKADTATAVTNMYLSLIQAADSGSEKQFAYEMGITAMLSSYPDQKDKEEIMNLVLSRIEKGVDAKTEIVKGIIENSTSKFSVRGTETNPLVIKTIEDAKDGE